MYLLRLAKFVLAFYQLDVDRLSMMKYSCGDVLDGFINMRADQLELPWLLDLSWLLSRFVISRQLYVRIVFSFY